jgi:hypothetical protein
MTAPNIETSNNPAVLTGGVFGNIIDGKSVGTDIRGPLTHNGVPISTTGVTQVTLNATNGISGTVTNPTTAPVINVSLDQTITVSDLNILNNLHATGTVSGIATLSAGQVVVANTDVAATSNIILTAQSLVGSATTARTYYVSSRIPGVSFTIRSTLASDTSKIGWFKIG